MGAARAPRAGGRAREQVAACATVPVRAAWLAGSKGAERLGAAGEADGGERPSDACRETWPPLEIGMAGVPGNGDAPVRGWNGEKSSLVEGVTKFKQYVCVNK